MITHKHSEKIEGAAACGVNVYQGKVISNGFFRRMVYFAQPGAEPTCRKCSGKTRRATVAVAPEGMIGKVFHRSYGYDMTINVFAKVIGQTAKGLICQELHSAITEGAFHPGSRGTAVAGSPTDKKPFRMFLKKSSRSDYQYYTGGGHSWDIWDGSPLYENRLD